MRKSRVALAAVAIVLTVCGMAQAKALHIEGTITSIDYTAKTIVVAATTVYATDTTVITICKEVASFDDLQVGQSVKVTGTLVNDQFVAKKICAKCKTEIVEP